MNDATQGPAPPDDALGTPPLGTPVRATAGSVHMPAARRIGRAVWIQATVMLVLVGLVGPAASFFAAGIWAAVTYLSTARALLDLLQRYDLTGAFARLDALDAATRVGLVSAGYFAVLCSTIVLAAGILGRGRTHTYLLPGLALLIPSALIFSLGARLTADVVESRYGVATPALSALFMYALFDALLLGTLLVDTRPRRGRAIGRRMWVRRWAGTAAAHTQMRTMRSAPVLRFGPSHLPDAPLSDAAPAESATPQSQPASEPSVVSGASSEPTQHAPEPEGADAQPLAGIGAPTPPAA